MSPWAQTILQTLADIMQRILDWQGNPPTIDAAVKDLTKQLSNDADLEEAAVAGQKQ